MLENYLLETPRMPSHLRGPHLDRMEGGIDHHPDWAGRPSLQQESSLQVFDPRIPDSAPADSEESNASPKSKLRISKCQPLHILWGNCTLMLLVRTEVAFPPVGHPKSLKPQTSVKLHFSASPPKVLFVCSDCEPANWSNALASVQLSSNDEAAWAKMATVCFVKNQLLTLNQYICSKYARLSCCECFFSLVGFVPFFQVLCFLSAPLRGGSSFRWPLRVSCRFFHFRCHVAFNKVASNNLSHYMYLGMALKTLWIVPRWSRRLERGVA